MNCRGKRGKKAREVRVAEVERRVKHLFSRYLPELFPTGLRDIIELLNHRYNLVRSVFAPFLLTFSTLINDGSSNAIVSRINCHTLPGNG